MVAFYIKLFTHFHASYMDYSRVQTKCKHSNLQTIVLYYLQENKTDWLYITLETEEPTLKFQPEMVLMWRVLKMKISAWQVPPS